MLYRFSLRQISVFEAIARTGSVSKAASQLSMSQSACSGALKELEKLYGIILFDRVGKRLKITNRGKQLRLSARRFLDSAGDLHSQLKAEQGLGILNIGATKTIGNTILFDGVKSFIESGGQCTIRIANTESIGKSILNFGLDLGLIEGELESEDLISIPWRHDELKIVCHPQHNLADQTLSIEALLDYRWVMREPGSGTREHFIKALGISSSELDISLEVNETEAICRAVAQGLGLSCLSGHVVDGKIVRGELAQIHCPQSDLSRQLYVAYHRYKYLDQTMEHFLSLILDAN